MQYDQNKRLMTHLGACGLNAAQPPRFGAFWSFVGLLCALFLARSTYAADKSVVARSLTPSSGYLASSTQILWTADNGESWTDVTPPLSGGDRLDFVQFQESGHGWSLMTTLGPFAPVSLRLAKTENSGKSWVTKHVPITEHDRNSYAAGASVSFSDARHGWLMLPFVSSASASFGSIYRTLDGGVHWVQLPPPPVAGAITFTSAVDGWLAGGAGGDELYKTRDGGASWTIVSLPRPDAIRVSSWPTVDVPHFYSTNSGVIVVTYSHLEGGNTAAVFHTYDGGASWLPGGLITLKERRGPGVRAPYSVLEGPQVLVFDRVGQSIRISSDPSASEERFEAEAIGESATSIVSGSAASEADAWVVASGEVCGDPTGACLLVTTDGGTSWTDRTPSETHGSKLRSTTASVVYAQGQKGFDTCAAPALTDLQAWWNATGRPYKFVNMYFGGSDRGCKAWNQSMITASWMRAVSTMGWALLPTWVGPQAPNTWAVGKYNLISTSPATAEQQGRNEASLAVAAAKGLGLQPGSVLFVDIEGQYSQDLTTRTAVAAYLNGWVIGLQSEGYLAGAYGHAYNIGRDGSQQSDWAAIANPPDAVWIVKVLFSNSCTSVFDLYPLPNQYWPSHQRLRQCTEPFNEQLGGVTLNIDADLADGPLSKIELAANPSVTLTTRQVSPSTITTNQSFSVNVTMVVNSATADHAGISVSFPSLTAAGASGASYNSSQGTVSTNSAPAAVQVYQDALHQDRVHLLAEADWSNVTAGSTKTFNLTVTPKQMGSFVVRIRGWVTTNGYTNAWRDPSSGTSDQQNYPVYEHVVNVTNSTTRIIRLAGDLAFGDVAVGGTSTRTLTISNDGNATLTVSGISYPSGFSGAWSGSIAPGASKAVPVTFAPSSATAYSGTVTVSSDKTSGGNTISLPGTGVSSSTRIIRLTGDLSFGTVAVGQTGTRPLTIHNDGNATLTVSSITYPAGFSGDWNGGAIGAGSARLFNITFAPSAASAYSGTVTVNSDKTSGTSTTTCAGTGSTAGQAVYDSMLKAPKCASIGSSCDSGTLLAGRAGLGPEPNAPNTILNSCGDGTDGVYQVDESNERLNIISTDGNPFAPGRSARIEATVWAYDAADTLDLYYTADAQHPNWLHIATFDISASGRQTLATTYTIPSGTALHAVRASFRYEGSPSPCTDGSYDDHDDLIFAVNNAAPGITVTPTSGLTTTEAGQTARFTVALNSSPSASVTIALSSSDTTEGTITPTALTFTTTNWSTPQPVSVNGVEDTTHDGDMTYTIVTTPATSSDANYNGLNAADVTVVNLDNDPLATPMLTAAFNGANVGINWSAISEAANYEVQRSYHATPYTPLYAGPAVATSDPGCPGTMTCLYRVRALDAAGIPSGWAVDVATTMTFVDATLSGMTIKVVHFTQLRAAINSVRVAVGRPPALFTGSIASGVVVLAAHLQELRTALDEARGTLGLAPLSYANPVIAGSSQIHAADIIELRNGVQ